MPDPTDQPTPDASPTPAHVIVTYDADLPSGLRALTCRMSDAYPDGTVVEDPPADAPILLRTTASRFGILHIRIGEVATPDAPPVWFVHVDEPDATPRATNLVAFVGDRFPAGTVIDNRQFATLGIRSDGQAGAIRWYPGGGLVHQVYVARAWRGRQLASHIIYAAAGFHRAKGWPGWLRGDGRLTELGQKLMARSRHPQRFAPLTEVMPPMD